MANEYVPESVTQAPSVMAAPNLIESKAVEPVVGVRCTVRFTVVAGVPVLVPDQGGAQEMVEHERTGLIFAAGDATALAAAITRLMKRKSRMTILASGPGSLPGM